VNVFPQFPALSPQIPVEIPQQIKVYKKLTAKKIS
jgi:hypothetical protein